MTIPEDYLNIDTPENVAFGYEVAGIGSRFLAALVDTILIIILQVIVNLVLFLLVTGLRGEDTAESNLLAWLVALFGLVSFAFFWGFYIFFELLWNGQSPGKRWVGLRVIRTDGLPIALTESIIRNLVRLVDFLPAYYGAGVVTMFINHQSRRLGDLAAGTLVVYDRATITLESLASGSRPSAFNRTVSDTTAALPLERLSSQDLEMVEEFLRRRDDLTNRTKLGKHLIQILFERMEQSPPEVSWWEAEKLLAEIVSARQGSGRLE
jgi:uncharacterized RDD family membrane protein YckC